MVLLLSILTSTTHADELLGDWSLDLKSGLPGWMSIQEREGQPLVYLRLYVGSAGPYKHVEESNGRLKFTLKKNKKAKNTTTVDVGIKAGKLDGVIIRQSPDGSTQRETFSGKKIPPMPKSAPDLSKVRFGQPIALFNGKDLKGWTAHKPKHEPEKKSGWSVEDGFLKNTTPKTDFSATGAYANLKTKAVFEDFWLHIEFLVEKQRNSGIYLRGMYEAQVVDRDSRMQGKQGVGAIFGMIEPLKNAGKPGGEWQTYDITLVDRHVTVILNGEKVIDNQPITGPTAGAVHTNPAEPGPIYLQGDHTNVSYRDIYLAPVLKD
jgi:hypothetical protein